MDEQTGCLLQTSFQARRAGQIRGAFIGSAYHHGVLAHCGAQSRVVDIELARASAV